MTTINKFLKSAGKIVFLAAIMANAHGAITDISQGPLVTSSTSNLAVKPNVFLMMDDSGSMDWSHMPDDAADAGSTVPMTYGYYGFRSGQCNGIYYDPTITYTAPVKADGTSYPDATFTAALNDGYTASSGSVNLSTSYKATDSGSISGQDTTGVTGYYYLYTGSQTTEILKNYYLSTSTFFKECSSALGAAPGNAVFTKQKLSPTETTTLTVSASTTNSTFTITVSGASSTPVSSITVGGTTITSGSSTGSATTNIEASNLALKITSNGYSVLSTVANVITVTGPATVGALVVVTKSSGSDTFAVSAITPVSVVSGITVNGVQLLLSGSAAINSSTSTTATNIAAKINATGYTATASSNVVTITGPTSAANFTPAVTYSGAMTYTTDVFPDTNAAHLTNFANWYSYYNTRINMMKTATGLAFNSICPKTTPAKTCNYRVGMATMNNNGGADFLNPDVFADSASPVSTQRTAFYAMLYGTKPGSSTPLLGALSNAGLMYANKLPGNALNTVTAKDPVQYSCQQNFTILSTDGFWNDATSTTINSNVSNKSCSPSAASSSTAVGNCDGVEARPMYDGATATIKTATPTTKVVQTQTVKGTTTTTPWTHIVTTVGGTCTITASTPPSNTTTAPQTDTTNNSYRIKVGLGLGSNATSPATGSDVCYQLSASGTSRAWMCRGAAVSSGTPSAPANNSSPVTDSNGTTWYLVSSVTGNTGCTTDRAAFANSTSTAKGACPGTAAVTGTTVTTQNQTATETAIGTNTSVDNATTVTTSTVSCTNNLCGAAVITTVGPTSSNVSINNTVTSDTTGSYTNTGGASNSCMATPPAAGTSTPVKGTSSIVYGSPATTTLSTTSTVGTPVVTTTTSGGTSNTLADVADYYYVTDLRTATLNNCTSGSSGYTLCTTPDPAAATPPALDLLNNVPSSGLDSASWQHMTTFTLGLGARGRMVFSPTYLTDKTGDYVAVHKGSLTDSTATPPVCSWQANGTVCNWPIPNVSGVPENIDDLWHTAVDGRGTYFNATNPSSLSTGISAALAGVSARTGSAASASISNPNISSGDNFIFSSNFVTFDWYGHLIRQQLDVNTGALSSVIDWDAGTLLDTNTARTIYAFLGTSANGLQAFNSTNFGSDANFATPHINSLAQFCLVGLNCLTPLQETAAAGANLVSYLVGDRTNEGYPADLTKYYRQRLHLLGDIVDSQAAYVKAPLLLYLDAGYSDYVKAKANRQSMMYVGANDGMLHAFYANSNLMDNLTGDVVTTGGISVAGGQEAWAFIPTAVMPNLYKLASTDYSSNHQYYVDGSPLTTDICPTTPAVQCGGSTSTTTTWKTILVSGLNGGGNSYFAMDITNPAAPKALWEFTNPNLGYSYGNPQVVKLGGTGTGTLAAGTWVVLLTSGYNNADGLGHLFVLNAYTGALLLDINTGVGSPASPSGLSKIIAQVVNPSLDATVMQVYGGDLFGNLWRFDVNGNVGAAGNDAQLLAVLKGPPGSAGLTQPITSKPEVGLVNGKTVVYMGTGRYLGLSDINGTDLTQLSPNLQTIYAIMDPLSISTTPSVAIYPNPRIYGLPTPAGGSSFVQQTELNAICPPGAPAAVCSFGQIIRTSTNNAVQIGTVNSGWYLDFPDSGERLNTDPALELGILAFNTNVPSASACTIGGNSYNYAVNYTSGSYLSTTIVTISAAYAATLPANMYTMQSDGTITMGVVAGQHTGSLSTAPIFISLPNGNKALCTNDSTGQLICRPVSPPPPGGGARRVSWRQLFSQ
jgi:type IV pilus assembly protein PilY1